MDADLCVEVLTADVALGLGVVTAAQAASALAGFLEARRPSLLGGVPASDRDRVEAEVRRLLDAAGGDAQMALAQRGVDRDLSASLSPEASRAVGETGARTRVLLRSVDPKRYVGFLPLGEGGMGVVYLALDTELNRRVAFKMVRPSLAPPGKASRQDPLSVDSRDLAVDLVARFMQEAVVTGGLEHPGIVPVYELGQTPAGAPYYTMRLVRGERTLDNAIAEARTLEARLALLEPFLKICDVVRYAHSRGVIHRDLKPANVALGQFGEVVVLDWGMAKMRNSPDLAGSRWQSRIDELRTETDLRTLTSALGTPGYMAPEAALGRNADIDERSDIYSLGAILHRILTGGFPFRFATFPEYLTEVRKGVSEIPDAPQGLARICLRALTARREDRYQDAGELAAAIRAWQGESAIDREIELLLGQAETALRAAGGMEGDVLLGQIDRAMALGARIRDLRPDHAGAAALQGKAQELRSHAIAEGQHKARRKLLRRVAVAGLLVATVATVLVAILLNQKRHEAEQARMREADQRARAEDLAGFMLFDLKTGLEPVGRLDLLRAVARKALQYYDSLPLENVTDEVRRARATAFGNIGDVFYDLDELGSAQASYRTREEILDALLSKEPDNPGWRGDQAGCLNRIGDVLLQTGDLPGALRNYEESTSIRRSLLEQDSANNTLRDDLSRSISRVADAQLRMGAREPAIHAWEEVLAIRRDLTKRNPENAQWQRSLASALGQWGEMQAATSGLDAALAAFEEALPIHKRLLDREPENTERQYDMAGAVFHIAYVHEEKGERDVALGHYRDALARYRALVNRDPSNAVWQRGVALSLDRLAEILGTQGHRDEQLGCLREAMSIKQRLAERDATNTRAQHDVASALVNLGNAAKETGDSDAAMESYREALAIARRTAQADPRNTASQEDVADTLLRMCDINHTKGENEAAKVEVGEALAIFRGLAALDPKHTKWARNTSLCLESLGDIAKDTGDAASALRYYLESLEIRRQLAEGDPENAFFQQDLVFALNRVAQVENESGDLRAALTHWEAAVAVNRLLAARAPSEPARQRELAASLYYSGITDEALGRSAEALRALREGTAIHARAVELAPKRYTEEHGFWTAAYQRLVLAADTSALESPADRLELGYALLARNEYARAATAFELALADDATRADLARANLYNAACAAAKAPDAKHWRPRALAWLAEDLQRRRKILTGIDEELRNPGSPERSQQLLRAKQEILVHFEHARTGDPDLASLRAAKEFEDLFAADR